MRGERVQHVAHTGQIRNVCKIITAESHTGDLTINEGYVLVTKKMGL